VFHLYSLRRDFNAFTARATHVLLVMILPCQNQSRIWFTRKMFWSVGTWQKSLWPTLI